MTSLPSELNVHRPSWQAKAACRGEDTAIFFPSTENTPQRSTPGPRKGTTAADRQSATARAKAICAGCPVRQECADYALEHAMYGIWGGLGRWDRARARRGRRGRTPGGRKAG